MTEQFPPDEFDEIAQRGGPVGVHRAPRPWWARALGPVLIFLLAGAAAYLVATYLWSQEVAGPDEPTPTISETVQSTVTPTADPTTSADSSEEPASEEPSPEPSPSDTAVVEFDTAVAVLNGSGISGLAARQQGELEGAGFTDVSAGNLTVSKPDENVVVYTSEELKATAEEVAKTLGIDLISLDATQTDADVEVHLVSDPS